ncbi:MAG: site-specific integrase [Peptococcaceae bacterium]|nr:site-specific integrase [Peptococcaceae bacterium]
MDLQQYIRMLRLCRKDPVLGKRHVAVLALVLFCGLTAGEICRLRVTDIHLENPCGIIVADRKSPWVKIPRVAKPYIVSYLKWRGAQMVGKPGHDCFLISANGSPVTTTHTLRYHYRKHAISVDMEKYSFKHLRLAFIVCLINWGLTMNGLAALLDNKKVAGVIRPHCKTGLA